jgi:hypothetical protein
VQTKKTPFVEGKPMLDMVDDKGQKYKAQVWYQPGTPKAPGGKEEIEAAMKKAVTYDYALDGSLKGVRYGEDANAKIQLKDGGKVMEIKNKEMTNTEALGNRWHGELTANDQTILTNRAMGAKTVGQATQRTPETTTMSQRTDSTSMTPSATPPRAQTAASQARGV